MAEYKSNVDFTFHASIIVEANSIEEAEEIIMSASDEVLTHIQGKSYADMSETTRSIVDTVAL